MLAGLAGITATPANAADPGSSLQVFVGYADNLRANPSNFPTPWDGAPHVVFAGCHTNCTFDAGAVRFVNNSPLAVTVDSLKVKLDTCVFDLWSQVTPTVLQPGDQLIATQTASGASGGCDNTQGFFDTSDIGPNGANWAGQCTDSGVVPEIDASINGTPSVFTDSGKVLNTGGVDLADCPSGSNESTQWTQVGSVPCPGSTLTLAPPSQTHTVGSQATVKATLQNSCGEGLQGAPIKFTVQSGPNAGSTTTVATDQNGEATLTYTSSAPGTDTLVATTTNPAGTITSNTVTVVWHQPQLTGRAYGIQTSGLVTIAPTPDTGSVATSTAGTFGPPCVATIGGLITAHTLCAQVVTTVNPFTSTATASVQDATVGVLGLPVIKVGVVGSSSHTTCSGSSGDATVASISVGGTPLNIDLHPSANTTLNVGVVTLVLNEQTPVPGGLTVNAVHIKALGLLDVVLASATSDIHNC